MDGITQRAQAATPDHQSYSQMGTPAAGGGWKVDRVGIRSAENGGFIVDCSKTRERASTDVSGNSMQGDASSPPGTDYQNKDYAFSSLPEVLSFLQQEFGGGGAAPPPAMGAVPGDYGEA